MELKCPQCGAVIAETDVDAKTRVGSCRACGAMLVVTRRGGQLVVSPADTVPHAGERATPEGERPPSFTASEEDESLTITFPKRGFGQGWRLLSVAAFTIVFAVVLARNVLVHRPPAFFMFTAGAVLLGLTALVMLGAGLYVAFGRSTVTISRAEAMFGRRLFGFAWRRRADLSGITRVQPFRMRQRSRVELFTCGLVIGERRYTFLCDLGDAEMFRLADLVNGFLKRVNAEDFAALAAASSSPPEEAR